MSSDVERINARVSGIRLSPTIAMSGRAASRIAEGRPVISLSLGELDFDTPKPIIDAAYQAALAGATRYTAPDGRLALKRAVQEKFLRDNGLSFEINEIHAASGCKQVIYNALAATLEPGDEVIVFAPYWVSYTDIVAFCGGTPVILQTSAADGFLPNPDQLAKAMTSRTRWVLLNSPNNPTGAVYDGALLKRLAATIASHPRAMALSDEIYEHLVYDGARHVSLLQAAPELRGRALTVNGVSKAYAMTGWRIGYAGGPQWLISAMAKVQSQTAGNSCTISQAAAEAALLGDQTTIEVWRDTLEKRRAAMLSELGRTDRIATSSPPGAFYVFADVSRCIGLATPSGLVLRNDLDLAEYLLDHADVAAVAGEAFGSSPFIRLSFAADHDEVVEAARRIVSAIDALAAVDAGTAQ